MKDLYKIRAITAAEYAAVDEFWRLREQIVNGVYGEPNDIQTVKILTWAGSLYTFWHKWAVFTQKITLVTLALPISFRQIWLHTTIFFSLSISFLTLVWIQVYYL